MGNDLSSVKNKFGLLAGLLGNISTATCGLAGKRTVAIHCRGGWTWNNLCVFDGPLEPDDRYDGMKLAFGEDGEILKPHREGPEVTYEKLDPATYNKLLVAVQSRKRAWDAFQDNRSRVTNDAVRYYRPMPVWEWATEQKFTWIVSGLYALPSLCPLPIMFFERSWNRDARPIIIYLILFAIIKAYVHLILYVNRYVCYIEIAKDAAFQTSENLWETLRNTRDISTLAPSAQESVVDVTRGRVRLLIKDDTEYLLVPVVGLRPLVDFDPAQWWFIARRLRGPLLTISWFAESTTHHTWSVAFSIWAFVEACLQDDVARVFLADTSTYSVTWLRVLPKHHYPEEYEEFHRPLV